MGHCHHQKGGKGKRHLPMRHQKPNGKSYPQQEKLQHAHPAATLRIRHRIFLVMAPPTYPVMDCKGVRHSNLAACTIKPASPALQMLWLRPFALAGVVQWSKAQGLSGGWQNPRDGAHRTSKPTKRAQPKVSKAANHTMQSTVSMPEVQPLVSGQEALLTEFGVTVVQA